MGLLSAEITAKLGKDPGQRYRKLTSLATPSTSVSTTPRHPMKSHPRQTSPEQVPATELAGEKIEAKLTTAPSNGAALGGLKVVTKNGWFAASPSGAEDVYKSTPKAFSAKIASAASRKKLARSSPRLSKPRPPRKPSQEFA